MYRSIASALAFAALFVTGCATKEINTNAQRTDSYEDSLGLYEVDSATEGVRDPLEGFNRAMFNVNDALFLNFIRPTALTYNKVVPTAMRGHISNMYANARYPGRAVNALLQGRTDKFAYETEAFFYNTVFGVVGFHRAADKMMDYKFRPEDTNQTLAAWGVNDGIYLVLPILGPTTTRGAVGMVGDKLLDPFTYIPSDDEWRMGIGVEERINDLSFRVSDYDSLHESALDPYISLKDIYFQYTRKKLRD